MCDALLASWASDVRYGEAQKLCCHRIVFRAARFAETVLADGWETSRR